MKQGGGCSVLSSFYFVRLISKSIMASTKQHHEAQTNITSQKSQPVHPLSVTSHSFLETQRHEFNQHLETFLRLKLF